MSEAITFEWGTIRVESTERDRSGHYVATHRRDATDDDLRAAGYVRATAPDAGDASTAPVRNWRELRGAVPGAMRTGDDEPDAGDVEALANVFLAAYDKSHLLASEDRWTAIRKGVAAVVAPFSARESALRAENERLRRALRRIVRWMGAGDPLSPDEAVAMVREAEDALKERESGE